MYANVNLYSLYFILYLLIELTEFGMLCKSCINLTTYLYQFIFIPHMAVITMYALFEGGVLASLGL